MYSFRHALLTAVIALTAINANASAAGEVNVYSYRQPFLIKPMFEAFTRETGIKVNTVFAKKGLVERLKREGVNSPADLIFTVDIGRLQSAVDAGVTQPVDSKLLEERIPEQYQSPDNQWFGLTTRARIIVASKDRIDEDMVKSYEDLADPKLKGKVCTRSGKHVYMVALTASMIAHHGAEKTKEWMSGMKDNLARKPQGNDRAQVKAISEGECDVAVINSYYMGNMMADEEQSQWADSVRIVFPNQDDRGTHMNVSGMALTKSAPNKENAIMLMEFLADKLAQQMYAEQNFEYPVNSQAPWSGLLSSWGQFKTDEIPLSDVAKNRGKAVKIADEVGYDG